jgi:MFS transporter, AAHS family, 4-hydroxybenzoate transporter
MRVDVRALIDDAPVGFYQNCIFFTCGLVAMVDGFDTQSIAFAAPAIAGAWKVSPSEFGLAFGAGLFGALCGGLLLGPVSDWIGRRKILVFSVGLFALTSYATAQSQSIGELIFWRFVTGLGLGGAIPCLIALTSDYAPKRRQVTILTAMFCGFPLGAVTGGILSAKIIETYGWSGVFTIGALAPLCLVPLIYIFLPESPQMLILRKAPSDQIAAALSRIVGPQNIPLNADFAFEVETAVRGRPKDLFRPDLRVGSVLISLLFFSMLMLAYFLVNWTPLLLRDAGLPIQLAIYGTVLLNLGGIFGSIVISRLSDRVGISRILSFTYIIGALAVAAIGMASKAGVLALAVVFVAGGLCIGAQLTATAVIAVFYPPSLVATASGWMMAVGRAGSLLGPIGAGLLISAGLSVLGLFWVAAIPALVCAAALFWLKTERTAA